MSANPREAQHAKSVRAITATTVDDTRVSQVFSSWPENKNRHVYSCLGGGVLLLLLLLLYGDGIHCFDSCIRQSMNKWKPSRTIFGWKFPPSQRQSSPEIWIEQRTFASRRWCPILLECKPHVPLCLLCNSRPRGHDSYVFDTSRASSTRTEAWCGEVNFLFVLLVFVSAHVSHHVKPNTNGIEPRTRPNPTEPTPNPKPSQANPTQPDASQPIKSHPNPTPNRM